MPGRSVGTEIADLTFGYAQQNNDIQILIDALEEKLRESATVAASSGRRLHVVKRPSARKFASRSFDSLLVIYARFADGGLQGVFLVEGIARFEALFGSAVRAVLLAYPRKLSISAAGIHPPTAVPLENLLRVQSTADALRGHMDRHVRDVFFFAPDSHLRYFEKVTGFSVTAARADAFIEAKATRDLVVHADRVINEVYLKKAGRLARGDLGDSIVADTPYLKDTLANLSKVATELRQFSKLKFKRRAV